MCRLLRLKCISDHESKHHLSWLYSCAPPQKCNYTLWQQWILKYHIRTTRTDTGQHLLFVWNKVFCMLYTQSGTVRLASKLPPNGSRRNMGLKIGLRHLLHKASGLSRVRVFVFFKCKETSLFFYLTVPFVCVHVCHVLQVQNAQCKYWKRQSVAKVLH